MSLVRMFSVKLLIVSSTMSDTIFSSMCIHAKRTFEATAMNRAGNADLKEEILANAKENVQVHIITTLTPQNITYEVYPFKMTTRFHNLTVHYSVPWLDLVDSLPLPHQLDMGYKEGKLVFGNTSILLLPGLGVWNIEGLKGNDIVLYVDPYEFLFFGGKNEIREAYLELEESRLLGPPSNSSKNLLSEGNAKYPSFFWNTQSFCDKPDALCRKYDRIFAKHFLQNLKAGRENKFQIPDATQFSDAAQHSNPTQYTHSINDPSFLSQQYISTVESSILSHSISTDVASGRYLNERAFIGRADSVRQVFCTWSTIQSTVQSVVGTKNKHEGVSRKGKKRGKHIWDQFYLNDLQSTLSRSSYTDSNNISVSELHLLDSNNISVSELQSLDYEGILFQTVFGDTYKHDRYESLVIKDELDLVTIAWDHHEYGIWNRPRFSMEELRQITKELEAKKVEAQKMKGREKLKASDGGRPESTDGRGWDRKAQMEDDREMKKSRDGKAKLDGHIIPTDPFGLPNLALDDFQETDENLPANFYNPMDFFRSYVDNGKLLYKKAPQRILYNPLSRRKGLVVRIAPEKTFIRSATNGEEFLKALYDFENNQDFKDSEESLVTDIYDDNNDKSLITRISDSILENSEYWREIPMDAKIDILRLVYPSYILGHKKLDSFFRCQKGELRMCYTVKEVCMRCSTAGFNLSGFNTGSSSDGVTPGVVESAADMRGLSLSDGVTAYTRSIDRSTSGVDENRTSGVDESIGSSIGSFRKAHRYCYDFEVMEVIMFGSKNYLSAEQNDIEGTTTIGTTLQKHIEGTKLRFGNIDQNYNRVSSTIDQICSTFFDSLAHVEYTEKLDLIEDVRWERKRHREKGHGRIKPLILISNMSSKLQYNIESIPSPISKIYIVALKSSSRRLALPYSDETTMGGCLSSRHVDSQKSHHCEYFDAVNREEAKFLTHRKDGMRFLFSDFSWNNTSNSFNEKINGVQPGSIDFEAHANSFEEKFGAHNDDSQSESPSDKIFVHPVVSKRLTSVKYGTLGCFLSHLKLLNDIDKEWVQNNPLQIDSTQSESILRESILRIDDRQIDRQINNESSQINSESSHSILRMDSSQSTTLADEDSQSISPDAISPDESSQTDCQSLRNSESSQSEMLNRSQSGNLDSNASLQNNARVDDSNVVHNDTISNSNVVGSSRSNPQNDGITIGKLLTKDSARSDPDISVGGSRSDLSRPVLLLEDDAVFLADWKIQTTHALREVPEPWDILKVCWHSMSRREDRIEKMNMNFWKATMPMLKKAKQSMKSMKGNGKSLPPEDLPPSERKRERKHGNLGWYLGTCGYIVNMREISEEEYFQSKYYIIRTLKERTRQTKAMLPKQNIIFRSQQDIINDRLDTARRVRNLSYFERTVVGISTTNSASLKHQHNGNNGNDVRDEFSPLFPSVTSWISNNRKHYNVIEAHDPWNIPRILPENRPRRRYTGLSRFRMVMELAASSPWYGAGDIDITMVDLGLNVYLTERPTIVENCRSYSDRISEKSDATHSKKDANKKENDVHHNDRKEL